MIKLKKLLKKIEQQKYEMYNPNNIFKEKNNLQKKEEFLISFQKFLLNNHPNY